MMNKFQKEKELIQIAKNSNKNSNKNIDLSRLNKLIDEDSNEISLTSKYHISQFKKRLKK